MVTQASAMKTAIFKKHLWHENLERQKTGGEDKLLARMAAFGIEPEIFRKAFKPYSEKERLALETDAAELGEALEMKGIEPKGALLSLLRYAESSTPAEALKASGLALKLAKSGVDPEGMLNELLEAEQPDSGR